MAASRAGSSSESREGEESDILSSNQVSVRLTESVSVASNLGSAVFRAEGDEKNMKKLAKSAPPLRFNIHVPSSRHVLLFSTPSFFLLFYALILAVNLT